MNVLENIKVALESIRSNFLRSLLTLLIIAVGIASLVGILTAIDSVLFSLSDNFNKLGAGSFRIYPAYSTMQSNKGGRRARTGDPIVFDQAMEFKEKFSFSGSRVSIEVGCSRNATIKYKEEKTTPTVRVMGIDENYLQTTSYEIEAGRNFSPTEVFSGGNRAILGSDIVKTLFKGEDENAVGNIILIGNNRYKVVGTLKQKGSSSGSSNDKRVFIALLNAKKIYGYADKNYNLSVSVPDPNLVDDAVSEAIGTMRNVRKLKAFEENDFDMRKSDGILTQLKEMTTNLRWGTIVIAMLTLLGASIGLMNIMLVSVTERTKEIGIRKAIGATSNNILLQFIVEAITICLVGGLVGIVLGILIGIGVTVIVKGSFFVPWAWITLGIIVCVIVGIISGMYPALKASRLDPIESLRYE